MVADNRTFARFPHDFIHSVLSILSELISSSKLKWYSIYALNDMAWRWLCAQSSPAQCDGVCMCVFRHHHEVVIRSATLVKLKKKMKNELRKRSNQSNRIDWVNNRKSTHLQCLEVAPAEWERNSLFLYIIRKKERKHVFIIQTLADQIWVKLKWNAILINIYTYQLINPHRVHTRSTRSYAQTGKKS